MAVRWNLRISRQSSKIGEFRGPSKDCYRILKTLRVMVTRFLFLHKNYTEEKIVKDGLDFLVMFPFFFIRF